MEKITSFTINHNKLVEGLYISRVDLFGSEYITTFDLRMKRPNTNDILSTTSAHTIEHLGATFLRNNPQIKDRTVYFGPMGCRTGFYALFHGKYMPVDVAELFRDMFAYIKDFQGSVPGASATECGNYRDLDMETVREDAEKYYEVLCNLSDNNTNYPS